MADILIGKGETSVWLRGKYGNRHGLVAGATGTGKTVSLMVMAEGFSRMGVPVFLADVKGDIAGLAVAGTMNERIAQRVAQIGIEGYANEANPVVFWDLYGKLGHPVRTTVSEMGPTLLNRILELNEVQSGVLDIAFKLADDQGLLLLDWMTCAPCSTSWSRTRPTSARNTAWSARPPSPRSLAPCCAWNSKAATHSSASPHSSWPT